jgi:hypothetical protein
MLKTAGIVACDVHQLDHGADGRLLVVPQEEVSGPDSSLSADICGQECAMCRRWKIMLRDSAGVVTTA